MAKEAIGEMLVTYHELNGDMDELHEDPSPLDLMRFVAKNRPFIVRGGCSTWPAMQKWNVEYLKLTMGDTPIKVAITPHGSVSRSYNVTFDITSAECFYSNADSVVMNAVDGSICFAKPFEEDEAFMDFLDHLRSQNLREEESLVKYSQTRT